MRRLRFGQGLQFTLQSLRSCVNWEQSFALDHYANPPNKASVTKKGEENKYKLIDRVF